MRISDWSSDVCSSDLDGPRRLLVPGFGVQRHHAREHAHAADAIDQRMMHLHVQRKAAIFEPFNQMTFPERAIEVHRVRMQARDQHAEFAFAARSEEHTSELQSLMRSSYAVFCLQKTQSQYNT